MVQTTVESETNQGETEKKSTHWIVANVHLNNA